MRSPYVNSQWVNEVAFFECTAKSTLLLRTAHAVARCHVMPGPRFLNYPSSHKVISLWSVLPTFAHNAMMDSERNKKYLCAAAFWTPVFFHRGRISFFSNDFLIVPCGNKLQSWHEWGRNYRSSVRAHISLLSCVKHCVIPQRCLLDCWSKFFARSNFNNFHSICEIYRQKM